MTITEFIKKRLNDIDMSQQQLATALNITRQNLNNKLSRDNFSSQELFVICQILKIDWKMTDNKITYKIDY